MSELKLEEINGLTVKELMELCKDANLPCYNGKNRKTKQELIDQICDYVDKNDLVMVEEQEENMTPEEILETVDIPVGVEDEIPEGGDLPLPKNAKIGKNPNYVQMNDNVKSVKENKPWEFKNRDQWIEMSEPGTLMAFIDKKGKPRTAALLNRSSKRREVKLVTEFDMEFIVPYDNVLWVKRSNRWPRGIYNLLKGIVANES